MMMLVLTVCSFEGTWNIDRNEKLLTVCSFEGTWNIDRNEKQCESAVFLLNNLSL